MKTCFKCNRRLPAEDKECAKRDVRENREKRLSDAELLALDQDWRFWGGITPSATERPPEWRRRKRPRAYPAFPAGSDDYRENPEMTDTHTRWSPKVTIVDEAEMARRAEANKGRTLPPCPYGLEEET